MIIKEEVINNAMMQRYSPDIYNKIKGAKVAIAGLGGLGSHIAIMLARTGIGGMLLVDFDVVEPSNLNRQSYNIGHLGLQKTVALHNQLKEINPFIKIDTVDVKVTEEKVEHIFKGYDIICEAFDNPESKAMLVNTVLSQLKYTTIVAGSGMAGYDSSNLIKTINPMKCLYICGDLKSEIDIEKGLMAPRVQICAAHQANMVLRLILGEDNV